MAIPLTAIIDGPYSGPLDIITPNVGSDTIPPGGLPAFRGLHITTAGTIKIKTILGNDVTLASGYYPSGVDIGIPFLKLYDTGTTAVLKLLV